MPVIGKENNNNRLRNFKNMGKDDVSRKNLQSMSQNILASFFRLNGVFECDLFRIKMSTDINFLCLGM